MPPPNYLGTSVVLDSSRRREGSTLGLYLSVPVGNSIYGKGYLLRCTSGSRKPLQSAPEPFFYYEGLYNLINKNMLKANRSARRFIFREGR